MNYVVNPVEFLIPQMTGWLADALAVVQILLRPGVT